MDILNEINKELRENVDIKYKEGFIKYFKGRVNPIGVRTKIVDRISTKYFREIKNLDKKVFLNYARVCLMKKKRKNILLLTGPLN